MNSSRARRSDVASSRRNEFWTISLACAVLTLSCRAEISTDGRAVGSDAPPTPPAQGPVGDVPSDTGVDSLFQCDAASPAGIGRRLVRLQDRQYAVAVAAAAHGRSQRANLDLTTYPGAVPFPKAPPAGRYTTRAADHVIDETNVDSVFDAARDAAVWLVQTIGVPCTSENMPACLTPIIEERGAILFGRPLELEERDEYVQVAVSLAADIGTKPAIEAAFEALLRAPQFLFRAELGDVGGGLTSYELAHAIAYGLTDGPADAALWQAAQSGTLNDAAAVKLQIERLLGSMGELVPLRRFLEEFADFDNVVNVTKDAEIFPFHDASALQVGMQRTLQQTLSLHGNADLLRKLLTYDAGFVGKSTAGSFAVDGAALGDPVYAAYPAGTRSGFLTEPAWLVAHSEPHRNNPISRGKFIRVELLCGAVPPIPIDADIKPLPDEPSVSMKQILAEHRIEPSCAGCHQLMDPLGLPFERFDHLGRYRDQELGAPIDTSGELTGSGNQDGPVTDALQLTERLAASSSVEQCFSKQVYQFFAGYEPTPADGCALSSIYQAFSQRQSLVDLFATLYAPHIYGSRKEP